LGGTRLPPATTASLPETLKRGWRCTLALMSLWEGSKLPLLLCCEDAVWRMIQKKKKRFAQETKVKETKVKEVTELENIYLFSDHVQGCNQ
jgi:hypothetical protein